MKYIAIVDLGINNLKSISGAIEHLGFNYKITRDEKLIMNSVWINIAWSWIFSCRNEANKKI
jgi:imidazoleglycerol phosphate synthase glutamine amidotransferase subunit HisH